MPILGTRNIPTVSCLYRKGGDFFGSAGGFFERSNGDWTKESFGSLAETGTRIAAALIDRGIARGAFIGLFADSGLTWLRANFGIQMCGGVDVPRGTDITPDEMLYIVRHSGMRAVILGNDRAERTWAEIAGQLPEVETVITAGTKGSEGRIPLDDLIRQGEKLGAAGRESVDRRIAEVAPEDLFTLIYTSGTTGEPKGVQLTHANMMSQVRNLPFDFGPGERFLSILPVWHIYERVFETIAVSRGCSTWFTSLKTIKTDLQEIRPTMMASAPRLWESLHTAIRRKVEGSSPVRRKLFSLALSSSRAVREGRAARRGLEEDIDGSNSNSARLRSITKGWLALPLAAALHPLVIKKLQAACGGRLRGTISGGGALPPEVDRFFNDIGIPVCEGYGLTETSPVVAVRLFEYLVLGTVGPLWPETEVRILDPESGAVLYPDPEAPGEGRGRRGEIAVRGPQVMKGYYKNPEATRKVLSEDGWFRTGDLGTMTHNDCLKIVGRAKETIVLSNGENVEPGPIENRLSESRWIEQCVVVGQDRKFLGALILPSLEDFKQAGLPVADYGNCSRNEEVRGRIQKAVRELVSDANGFKPFERVLRFHLLDTPFEVGKELTKTFKLKRHVIHRDYADRIDALYR